MSSESKNFELFLWRMLPSFFCLVFLCLCLIPKHIWGMNVVMPMLPIFAIFYWGRLSGAEISYFLLFFIGLIFDALSGLPLGLSSLFYIIFLFLVQIKSKNLQKEAFVMDWIYFSAIFLAISVGQWIILSLIHKAILDIIPALIQMIVTVGIYPMLHKFFDVVEQKRQERRYFLSHV